MSSTVDKIKGLGNEAAGNVKQGIGKATDNEKLQAEGKAQELKGEAQKTVGDAKDAVKDGADAVKRKL
ncbi:MULTISPECIES: CsbD family protein [Methylobacterium]|uniref:Stress response protein CsbD n=1 Tax=Methylobacterium thuringiense TaxID=1003091 RepID=A0ABQ4TQJ9_9HYPH|nr:MULTISPECIES: CsbD family protein [Methylobacterium]TXN24146.1 CsbD family protein [Methylobacterium sp. WL9]GJE56310.1 Stress response protein CsbD [Methylobacterium thuringiense]